MELAENGTEARSATPAGEGPAAAVQGRAATIRSLLLLLVLQAVAAWLVLRDFILGEQYFAYLDIAADTYEIFTGQTILLAQLFAREGWSGWSFGLGLGAPVITLFGDSLRVLAMLGGPEHVLQLRIWVYLLKLALGGIFFFLLVRGLVRHRESALVAALLYSFCGYMIVNGVWDTEANPFVFFPLVLLGALRLLRHGDRLTLPLGVAATLLSGVFVLYLVVSLAVAGLVAIALARDPLTELRGWLLRVAPMAALGCLLAAPLLLPMLLQLADSPRVRGTSLLEQVLREGFELPSLRVFLAQVGGLLHKDLFGSASYHRGQMNYLEAPGFWVGLLPLLLLPQLWRGDRQNRRVLVVLVAGTVLYMLVPAVRLSAFGFASPYYRCTTLWITFGLLLAGTRALDRVFSKELDLVMLGAGVALVAGLLAAVLFVLNAFVAQAHVVRLGVLLAAWSGLLLAVRLLRFDASRAAAAVLALAVVEIVMIAWPSYRALRPTVSAANQPFEDVTKPALAAIRASDPGTYRVEKTFHSVSEADAAAQGYMGVKSYLYHGRAVVDFHRSMALMRDFGRMAPPVNHTNWLAAPGDRYLVHSLLGVKYVISKTALHWPGFTQAASAPGWFAYRNDFALPLGVVQSRQVTRAEVAKLSALPPEREQWFRDLALINAVVLDEPMPPWGARWDLAGEASRGNIDLEHRYAKPARALQESGLKITSFRNDHIVGRIAPRERGILVFSIPFYQGWSLKVDGRPVPLMRANFGMLAAPVEAGVQEVELSYALPGLRAGLLAGAAGLLLVGAVALRNRRRISPDGMRSQEPAPAGPGGAAPSAPA